eukprot:274502-Pleurochrysis_carterae.AAC.3
MTERTRQNGDAVRTASVPKIVALALSVDGPEPAVPRPFAILVVATDADPRCRSEEVAGGPKEVSPPSCAADSRTLVGRTAASERKKAMLLILTIVLKLPI